MFRALREQGRGRGKRTVCSPPDNRIKVVHQEGVCVSCTGEKGLKRSIYKEKGESDLRLKGG